MDIQTMLDRDAAAALLIDKNKLSLTVRRPPDGFGLTGIGLAAEICPPEGGIGYLLDSAMLTPEYAAGCKKHSRC